MNPSARVLWNGLKRSNSFIDIFSQGLEGDDWTERPCGLPNSALWILGHLALNRAFFLGMLWDSFSADAEWGPDFQMDTWGPLFGMGEEPQPADRYPDLATCRAVLEKGLDAVKSYLENATLDDLDAPPCISSSFLKTKTQVIVHMTHHESHHTGSLSMIRRLLGKERLF